MKRLLLLSMLLAAFGAQAQINLYVDSSATASGVGTSWASAYKTLNEALNVANAGSLSTKYVISIAQGTYYPTGVSAATNRDSTFLIRRSGIVLYGGYPQGGGTRNISLYPVVLSGKLNTVKSYHVMVIAGAAVATDSAILDGLTITKGLADGTGSKTYNSQAIYSSYGAGLYINNFSGKVLLTSCTFSADSAYQNGGGLYNNGGVCSISNSSFLSNAAFGNVFSAGGGVFDTAAISSFSGCTFSGNFATRLGGGISTRCSDTVRNCTFNGNVQNLAIIGSGIVPGGGAIQCVTFSSVTTVTISKSTFSGNSGSSGGAIYGLNYNPAFTKVKVDGCIFFGNSASGYGGGAIFVQDSSIITRCRFTGNSASNDGGAVHFDYSNVSSISSCLFSGNKANGYGGAVILSFGKGIITNCTFSGDSAINGGNAISAGSSIPSPVTNCIIWDGNSSLYNGSGLAITYSIVKQATGVFTGTGNLNADPLFVSPLPNTLAPTTAGNYRLQPCSPAINAGLNSAPYAGALDVVDSARIYATTIDMGAYEFQSAYTASFAAIAGNSSVCTGGTIQLTHTATGGTWSSSNSAVATVSSTGIVTGIAAGTDTIAYIVGTVPACNNFQRKVITVLPSPARPTASGNTPVCVGDTLRLAASTSLGSPVFSWTGPGAFTSAVQNPIIANTTAASAGVYRLTVTGANGCVSPKDSVIVNISCLDSVWAGDANYDKTVDNLDALEIGLAMGSTGNARPGASIAWQPAYCRDWATMLVGYPAINRKHADCNGDGLVSYSDTLAVVTNYALTHLKEIHVAAKTAAGLPDLYFDFTGIAPIAGTSISVPLKLGTALSPMANVAGIAAQLIIADVTPADTPSLSYGTSWLGAAGNTLRLSKAINKSRVDWAYTRTDQRNNSGSGILALLTFTIPAGTKGQQMRLYFDKVLLVDSNGQPVTQYNALEDTVTIIGPEGIAGGGKSAATMAVSPNPSAGACNVQLSLPSAAPYQIELRDVSGKLLLKTSGQANAGANEISLPTRTLSAGVYLISLSSEGEQQRPVKWIKE